MAKRYFITTPIYYVNDEPHLGHAYTTVAADVLARHIRIRYGKDNVFFLTGTDEHGTKVQQKAASLGKDPQIFTDEVAAQYKDAWQRLNISYDYFIRTTDSDHVRRVSRILLKFKVSTTPRGNPCVYEAAYKGLYCIGCEKFLTEKELVNGTCPDHGTTPEMIEEKNWFFRLSDYLPMVEKKIKSGECSIYPQERKHEALGLLKQGIDDFSISRSSVTWGIPIPWDESQKAYVWVDALSNYITALGYPEDEKRMQTWWSEAVVYHLMALDILKFHTIYWPAMLIALGLPVPDKEYIHGFFTIDGQKMSKSLGNVIVPNELVQRYGSDATRYLLLSQFSFGYESDIKVQDFNAKYNADLANGLGNTTSRITNMVEKCCNGSIGSSLKSDNILEKEVDTFISQLQFREALLCIWRTLGECDQLIESEKPWKLAETDAKKLERILQDLCRKLFSISQALKPFLPETAQKIERALTARRIVKAEPLFARMKV